MRLNTSGLAASKPTLDQGFDAIHRATFIGLTVVGLLWLLGSANPGNWFVEFPEPSRWVARLLLFSVVLGPAWVAVRGIGCDKAGRVFTRRHLSRILAVVMHIALSALVVVSVTAIRFALG